MKTSVIYSISTERLKEIVKSSTTFTQILNYFQLKNRGGNHKTLKGRLNNEGIDYSHVGKHAGGCKGSVNLSQVLSLEECLLKIFVISNEPYNHNVKKYLKRYSMIPYECFDCKNLGQWNNKPITLELDHINGISNDNRLINLQYLCPNCHSQTPTFRGRNRRKVKVKVSDIEPNWRHRLKPHARKVIRPSKEKLEILIWQKTFTQLSKELGVSDVAIKKWCKLYGITKFPPIGYWLRNKTESGQDRTDVDTA